jgi:hypothetical protein
VSVAPAESVTVTTTVPSPKSKVYDEIPAVSASDDPLASAVTGTDGGELTAGGSRTTAACGA